MNYNSINEILSAGITNMEVIRNNTKQDDNSDTITGVSWFTFNGVTASNIYANGNSWIGFGSSSEHLKVNRRDGAMYSLYREEGTLFNYYKFLKIRWKGYSIYSQTSSSCAIEYDVILWDTGDISLHMVSIPTAYNDGIYSLTASSTYTYTISTSSPDVTFIKTDSSFEVSNEIINLELPYEKRYLIRSGSTYYTVVDNVLNKISETDISSATFLNYGITEIPTISLLGDLSNPEILYWVDSEDGLVDNLVIQGTPPLPQIIYYEPQSIAENSGIKTIEASCSKDVFFTITFDEGTTWYYYDTITVAWVIAETNSVGMNPSTLKSIMPNIWTEVVSSSTYQIRCVLPSTESYVDMIAVEYI